jgi:hypothetical protein
MVCQHSLARSEGSSACRQNYCIHDVLEDLDLGLNEQLGDLIQLGVQGSNP